jgi:hypothetical protein
VTTLLCTIFALVFAGVVLAALPIVRAWNSFDEFGGGFDED